MGGFAAMMKILFKGTEQIIKEHFSEPKDVKTNIPITKEDLVEAENRVKGIYCDQCRNHPAVYNMQDGRWLCKHCAPWEPWRGAQKMKMTR